MCGDVVVLGALRVFASFKEDDDFQKFCLVEKKIKAHKIKFKVNETCDDFILDKW